LKYNNEVSTQDTLNIFLLIALLIITGCIVYTTYYFVQALKSIANLTDNLEDATESIKNRLQMKALKAIPGLLVSLIAQVIKKRRG